MKTITSIAIVFLVLGCNVYNSESREFISKNSSLQNGQIVVNSTDNIGTSYCYLNKEIKNTKLALLDQGSYKGLDFDIWQGKPLQIQIKIENYNHKILCEYNLKEKITQQNKLTSLLDLSIDIFTSL